MSAERNFDVVVIGGGVSGLGIARAASRAGFKTALLERASLGEATSANSLRIIHGGFRYLQQLNLSRVIESIRAQALLMREFPDLVEPLPCALALKPFGLKSALCVNNAHRFYSLMRRLTAGEWASGRILGEGAVNNELPILERRAPHGVFLWHDAVLKDPALLAQRLATLICERGEIFERHEVHAISFESGRYVVQCRMSNGESGRFSARAVVNAAGPWINSVGSKNFVNLPDFAGLQWCRAFNIVISRQLDPRHAVAFYSPAGRLFFTVPRGAGTAIGTEYLTAGRAHSATVTPQEVSEFLAQFNSACPGIDIRSNEVTAIESGLLPMRRLGTEGPELYGAEQIAMQEGYLEVLSTKYTTFPIQAERVVARITRYLSF